MGVHVDYKARLLARLPSVCVSAAVMVERREDLKSLSVSSTDCCTVCILYISALLFLSAVPQIVHFKIKD